MSPPACSKYYLFCNALVTKAAISSTFHAGCVELEIVVGAGIGLLENATFTLLASNAFVTSAAISCTFHFSFAKEETPPGVFVLSHAPCVAADAFRSHVFLTRMLKLL